MRNAPACLQAGDCCARVSVFAEEFSVAARRFWDRPLPSIARASLAFFVSFFAEVSVGMKITVHRGTTSFRLSGDLRNIAAPMVRGGQRCGERTVERPV